MTSFLHNQLSAFAAVVRMGSITRGAKVLEKTQPTLSRHIKDLEHDLGVKILERGRAGVELTFEGQQLHQFIEAQQKLENELRRALKQPSEQYIGIVRIAGLSSLVPSVVLPALAPFLREYPTVEIEVHRNPDRRYLTELREGRIHIAIAGRPADTSNIVDTHLGEEEFVMIESRSRPARVRRDIFLDVSEIDTMTQSFFRAQPENLRPKAWARSFMHDGPGLLLGVELGLGRAVVPRHMIRKNAGIRIDRRFAPVRQPVYLLARKGTYSRLHDEVQRIIESGVRKHLAKWLRHSQS